MYYRDNDTPADKRECDSKMLAELNALVPKGRGEKVDRQLVRSIIGTGDWEYTGEVNWRMNLTNQYGNDLKNVLHSLNKSMIYGLQI